MVYSGGEIAVLIQLSVAVRDTLRSSDQPSIIRTRVWYALPKRCSRIILMVKSHAWWTRLFERKLKIFTSHPIDKMKNFN